MRKELIDSVETDQNTAFRIKTKFNFIVYPSNSGSKFHTKYEYKTTQGITELVPTEEVNTYNEVQSYKEETSIYKILDRMTRGDYSALDKNQGIFMDCTNLPKDINELTDFFNNYESTFNQADPRFKELFNNNYKQLIFDFQNGTFEEKYKKYNELYSPEKLQSNNVVSSEPINFENKEVNDNG